MRLRVYSCQGSCNLSVGFALDERYMLIWRIDTEHASAELTICYRRMDGSWTDRIEIPFHCGGFLTLSPEGKYLLFGNEGTCRISTSFIDEQKPQDLE